MYISNKKLRLYNRLPVGNTIVACYGTKDSSSCLRLREDDYCKRALNAFQKEFDCYDAVMEHLITGLKSQNFSCYNCELKGGLFFFFF